ncbi:MAG: hypothetical protein AAB731_00395 [Patescibacteria group bacterium]
MLKDDLLKLKDAALGKITLDKILACGIIELAKNARSMAARPYGGFLFI